MANPDAKRLSSQGALSGDIGSHTGRPASAPSYQARMISQSIATNAPVPACFYDAEVALARGPRSADERRLRGVGYVLSRRQPTTSCTSRHTPMVQSSRVSEASELGARRGHSRPPLRYVDCTQRALSLHRPECASQSRRDDPYAALPERPLDQLCTVDIFFGICQRVSNREEVTHEQAFHTGSDCFTSFLQLAGPHACAEAERRRDRFHSRHGNRFDLGRGPWRRSRGYQSGNQPEPDSSNGFGRAISFPGSTGWKVQSRGVACRLPEIPGDRNRSYGERATSRGHRYAGRQCDTRSRSECCRRTGGIDQHPDRAGGGGKSASRPASEWPQLH